MMDGSQASLSVDGAASDGPAQELRGRGPAPGENRTGEAPLSAAAPPPVVCIGDRAVGRGQPVYVIAEIGINHNGSIDLAKRLISVAVAAGCDAVKFQKRTVDVVYSEEELARPRESPFGETNGDLKRGLEFDTDEFVAIDEYCRMLDTMWFASCWDEASVDFIEAFAPPKIERPISSPRDVITRDASQRTSR